MDGLDEPGAPVPKRGTTALTSDEGLQQVAARFATLVMPRKVPELRCAPQDVPRLRRRRSEMRT